MTDGRYPWDDLGGQSTRTPRAVEGRETTQRTREWREPTLIPEIPPRDGWVFKWVRVANRDKDDPSNLNKRRREGWEAVRIEEFPWLSDLLMTDVNVGNIETGGLLLCKMSEEMVAQRNRFYLSRARAQRTSAEESYMRDNQEIAMAKFRERKASTFTDRRDTTPV